MIRVRYFKPSYYRLLWCIKPTATGYGIHAGPFSIYLDTDRLP